MWAWARISAGAIPTSRWYWTHDKGYARNLVDFGAKRFPPDLQGYQDYPNITARMQARGWPEDRIRKVMGVNWLGFLEKVWGA